MVPPSVESGKEDGESREASSEPASPFLLKENKTNKNQELLRSLLKTQHTCEVHPDLHKIIQVLHLYSFQ